MQFNISKFAATFTTDMLLRKWGIWSAIQHLLAPASPAAISRLISFFVVDTVKLKSWWARSKSIQERYKVIAPFIAYSYAASAVACISFILLIIAAGFCTIPSSIFARKRFRVAVDASPLTCGFFSEASTTPSTIVPSQAYGWHNNLVSTIAPTIPPNLRFASVNFTWRLGDNYQSSKAFAG
jgi:hypothetical protein